MPERKVIALLMTDVVGSTRLEQRFGQAFFDWLQSHVDAATSLALKFGGRVLKQRGEGDSVFAVFDHPQAAMDAAVAWQHAFRALPELTDPVLVRMAIDYGEAYALESDFWGGLVNRCARIRELAQGSQILLSQAAAEAVSFKSLLSLGVHNLRDVEVPVALWQVLADGLPSEFAPPRSVAISDSVPSYGSSLVGREEERVELRRMLLDHPVITLLGPGGSGKTRLAVEVARRSASQFKDGVAFLDLNTVGSSLDAVAVLSAQFDSPIPAGSVADFSKAVQSKTVLLLLDNAESDLGIAAEIVKAFIKQGGQSRILVSSREPLGLPQERRFVLPPLGGSAVRLLYERAEAAGSLIADSLESRKMLESLADAVDRLPLGIELIAPMLASLDLTTIQDLLAQFGTLGIEAEKEHGRHRSLEAMLAYSIDRLSAPDQVALFSLGLFSSPFSLEIASAVWDISGWEAAQRMKRLVEKSLVQFEPRADLPGRYRLLYTTVEYARKQPLPEHVEIRFVECVTQWAERLDADLRAHQSPATMRAWDEAAPTIRAALERCLSVPIPECGMRLLQAGSLYWGFRPGIERYATFGEELAKKVPENTSSTHARFLNSLAVLLIRLQKFAQAKVHAERALENARGRGDQTQTAKVLVNLGLIAQAEGNLEMAIDMGNQAAAIFESLEDAQSLGIALGNLGVLHNSEGTYEQAIHFLQRAIQVLDSAESYAQVSLCYQNLAEVYLVTERYEEVLANTAASAQVAEPLGLQGIIAQAGRLAAIALLKLGRNDEAHRIWLASEARSDQEHIMRRGAIADAYQSEATTLAAMKSAAKPDPGRLVEFLINASQKT